MTKNIIIFDLDGTLALIDHRRHLVEKELAFINLFNDLPKREQQEYKEKMPPHIAQEQLLKAKKWKPDWDAFYDACDKDLPNDTVIKMYKMLSIDITYDWDVYIFSGRSEVVRDKTTQWLRKYGIFGMDASRLFMRPEKDYTPDEQLKKKWLENIGGPEKVFCVFDDRDKVCKMWRSMGITCFQVAEGKF